MTCLNIALSNSDNINTFIFVNKSVAKYVDLCRKQGVNVEVYEELFTQDRGSGTLTKYLSIFFNIFKVLYVLKHLPISFNNVDELLVPSDDIICRATYKLLKKRNKNLVLSLFDDGVGTYGGNVFRKKNKLGAFIYSLLLNNDYCDRIAYLYCYQKNLVKNIPSTIQVITIHNNTKIIRVLFNLTDEVIEMYRGVKVLFLDQGLTYDEINSCLHILYERFHEAFAIKAHPRISPSNYSGYRVINDGIPIEAIISSCLEPNCLLISHCSGGCISSFIMGGDANFSAIFLTDIIKNDAWSQVTTGYIRGLISEINASNVYIPTSIEEFCELIK